MGIALRIDAVAVGAVHLRALARETAGGIGVLGVRPPTALGAAAPSLHAHQSQELARQTAGLVLADELPVDRHRQAAPRRAQADIVARHLVAGLLGIGQRIIRIVPPAQHVPERAEVALASLAAELRRAAEADLEPGLGFERQAGGKEFRIGPHRQPAVARRGPALPLPDAGRRTPGPEPAQPRGLEGIGEHPLDHEARDRPRVGAPDQAALPARPPPLLAQARRHGHVAEPCRGIGAVCPQRLTVTGVRRDRHLQPGRIASGRPGHCHGGFPGLARRVLEAPQRRGFGAGETGREAPGLRLGRPPDPFEGLR